MSDFATKVRNIVGTNSRTISLRPRISEEYFQVMKDTMRKVTSVGATGGVSQIVGPSGIQTRSRPIAADSSPTLKWAIVKDIGTGEEPFVWVKEIHPTPAGPEGWDGTWFVKPDESPERVSCEIGLKSKAYGSLAPPGIPASSGYVVEDDIIEPSTPIVAVVRDANKIWIAWRTWKFGVSKLPRAQETPITDCLTRARTIDP